MMAVREASARGHLMQTEIAEHMPQVHERGSVNITLIERALNIVANGA